MRCHHLFSNSNVFPNSWIPTCCNSFLDTQVRYEWRKTMFLYYPFSTITTIYYLYKIINVSVSYFFGVGLGTYLYGQCFSYLPSFKLLNLVRILYASWGSATLAILWLWHSYQHKPYTTWVSWFFKSSLHFFDIRWSILTLFNAPMLYNYVFYYEFSLYIRLLLNSMTIRAHLTIVALQKAIILQWLLSYSWHVWYPELLLWFTPVTPHTHGAIISPGDPTSSVMILICVFPQVF